jgi:hypothetical protein
VRTSKKLTALGAYLTLASCTCLLATTSGWMPSSSRCVVMMIL